MVAVFGELNPRASDAQWIRLRNCMRREVGEVDNDPSSSRDSGCTKECGCLPFSAHSEAIQVFMQERAMSNLCSKKLSLTAMWRLSWSGTKLEVRTLTLLLAHGGGGKKIFLYPYRFLAEIVPVIKDRLTAGKQTKV